MAAPPHIQAPPACSPYDPNSQYFAYGYQPSLATGIILSILFGLISLVQSARLLQLRAWWMLFFVVGAGLECLGWIARSIAHQCVYSNTINTLQTCALIMGPAWTQAGVYISLWVLILKVGKETCPLKPQVYLWTSVNVDTVCLGLQAAGGGIAASAAHAYADPATGTWIMVAGIISQLACGIVFLALSSLVFWRGKTKITQNRSMTLVCFAISLSTCMMILRGLYRSVELWQGWTGYSITHESYLIALDAAPMIIAMGVLAVLNPGHLLETAARQEGNRRTALDKEKRISESSIETLP